MSTSSKRRLPVSTANALLVGVFLLGAVVAASVGRWSEAAVLTVAGLIGLVSAVYARRADASDVTRVNAIEYRDERDKRIAQVGFAAVGAVALVISVVEVVLVVVLGDSYDWVTAAKPVLIGQLVLLCAVWAVANSIAARRG